MGPLMDCQRPQVGGTLSVSLEIPSCADFALNHCALAMQMVSSPRGQIMQIHWHLIVRGYRKILFVLHCEMCKSFLEM